jgi:hypothetical protein
VGGGEEDKRYIEAHIINIGQGIEGVTKKDKKHMCKEKYIL